MRTWGSAAAPSSATAIVRSILSFMGWSLWKLPGAQNSPRAARRSSLSKSQWTHAHRLHADPSCADPPNPLIYPHVTITSQRRRYATLIFPKLFTVIHTLCTSATVSGMLNSELQRCRQVMLNRRVIHSPAQRGVQPSEQKANSYQLDLNSQRAKARSRSLETSKMDYLFGHISKRQRSRSV